MSRLAPALFLFVSIPAFAGPIGEESAGTATATVNLSATLDTSTAISITGRNGDPFIGDTLNIGNVSFGNVNLATGTTTADLSTGFVIHDQIVGPEDNSITLFVMLNLDATLTGVNTGDIMIGGTDATAPSDARWTCAPSAGVWGSATTYNANQSLEPTAVSCADLVTGLNEVDGDFALHIPADENAASVSAQFIVTVVPGT